MIEMLGVGVLGGRTWIVRGVCRRFEGARLVAVVSPRADVRHALLDVTLGRRVPEEGRAWVNGVPVMADTAGRVRRIVGEVDLRAPLGPAQSTLGSLLAAWGPRLRGLGGVVRLPRPSARRRARAALERVGLDAAVPVAGLDGLGRARVRVAAALDRPVEWLVVRDPDVVLGSFEAGALLGWLGGLVTRERLGVLVSLGHASAARGRVEGLLRLDDGGVTVDGTPAGDGPLSTAIPKGIHSTAE